MQQEQTISQVSYNLPDNRYIPLRQFTKKPLKEQWNNNPISRIDANQYLNDNYNIGFLLGNGYICLDCDSLELQLAIEQLIKQKTYTQKSAKRGLNQYIFKINFKQESLSLSFRGNEVGEILADTTTSKGKQVVLSPSKYKITTEDAVKNSNLQNNINEIREYLILEDIEPTEITKEELLQVILQFDSKFNKDLEKKYYEEREKYNNDLIDDIRITEVLSTGGMKKDNQGQYFGSNPWHGSSTGHNFFINPNKNLAYCFRCDCAISPAKAIALNEGILNNCSDSLRGMDFIKTKEAAREKYGLQVPPSLNASIIEKKKPELNWMTIKDYEEYKSSKDYIIENLMFPAEIGMSYAPSSNMKSLSMMHMALCISSGKKYFKFKVKPCAVGILSAENSIKTDKERLRKIMRGLGIRKKNIPLYILPRSQCGDILSLGFKESIFDFIREKQIKVLFMDTINPLTPEIDDNKAKDVTKVFREVFKILSDEYKIAVWFLHHTDKMGNSFLGSIKWKSNADTIFRIQRDGLSNVFRIYNEKNREGETNTLEIEIEFLEKKINFKLLNESKPEIFKKVGRKSSQSKILKEKITIMLSKKPMSRGNIIKDFKLNKIKITSSLDNVLRDFFRKNSEGEYELK